jgi:trehalose/maltose hydrolase-like predicted phosphorylase
MAHASVLAAMDPERAWSTFREALDADLDDTQGGTTRAGIHLGAMAGSIDTVQRSFAGLRMAQDELVFAPRLPAGLHRVSFTVRYRDSLLKVALDHQRLTVTAAPGVAAPVRVRMGLNTVLLHAGQSHGFLVRPSA